MSPVPHRRTVRTWENTTSSLRQRSCGHASTRSAIAELMELRPATLAAWASGKATPAVDRIVDLARASGVDLDWLLTGVGPSWHDPEVEELVSRFRQLTPSGRAFVLEAARMAARRGRATKKKAAARKLAPRRKRTPR